jgi:Fe2+ or Zn2+ uptake regulation protein
MLLKQVEVVRSVGTVSKVGYYLLNVPGEHSHFLICRRCGAIRSLPCHESLDDLEREVAGTEGYSRLYHELTFYGICPNCQQQPADPLATKLPVRP